MLTETVSTDEIKHVEITHSVSKDEGEHRERKTRTAASNGGCSNITPSFPLTSSATRS